MTPDSINWDALRAPFNPADVDFRLQSTFERGGETKGIAIAYMDARLVQDRLDEVVGPENWSFDWQPMATKDNAVIAAKGTLTICGVSKSDIGDCDATERNKASVSDALKRAAVMWGIGRYLYGLGTFFCSTEQRGKNAAIPDAEITRLRLKLPDPTGATPQAATGAASPAVIKGQPAIIRNETGATPQAATDEAKITTEQITTIRQYCQRNNRTIPPTLAQWTFQHATEAIAKIQGAKGQAQA